MIEICNFDFKYYLKSMMSVKLVTQPLSFKMLFDVFSISDKKYTSVVDISDPNYGAGVQVYSSISDA